MAQSYLLQQITNKNHFQWRNKSCSIHIGHKVTYFFLQMQTHKLSYRPLASRGKTRNGRLRIALVGLPNSGKSTIFDAVAGTRVRTGRIGRKGRAYAASTVQIDQSEIHLVDLPGLTSLRHLHGGEREALQYLLWGEDLPLVSRHEPEQPPVPLARPDVLVQVVDASDLQRSLEMTLELARLGLPMVIALNMMDQARRKGIRIDCNALAKKLGVPVVPMVALKGQGILETLDAAFKSARNNSCLVPTAFSTRLQPWIRQAQSLITPEIAQGFSVPTTFLVEQLLEQDDYFTRELLMHFPEVQPVLREMQEVAAGELTRPLAEEISAERHHRAAAMFKEAVSIEHGNSRLTWEDRLDAVFLHPRWGLIGTLAIFALVLFMVFEVAAVLDAHSSAWLAEQIEEWQPDSLTGIIGRAVADGLIGLIGIVVPYMLPLVLMLVALELAGVMQRIAFVVDRFFHRIGLHGKVAVPFLMGLGCNVPAIGVTRSLGTTRDRIVASILITFVPCSARSAVVMALGGKYLGGLGVFAIFMTCLIVIAILGRLLSSRYPETSPGVILEIPPYAVPKLPQIMSITWLRTSDIITIVTPLLVGGSIILALLQYGGVDAWINLALTPVTEWALGLPALLGVPLLFGVLRKELSLLMIYQALGTFEVETLLNSAQIFTLLIFIMLYIPCVSTFAVMLRVIGWREAVFSVSLSVVVALMVAMAVRLLATGVSLLT